MSTVYDLVNLLINIIGWLLMVRFWLQWARADFYNPISQVIVKITDPLLKPFRKIMPYSKGFDFASLLLIVLIPLLGYSLIFTLSDAAFPPFFILILAILKKTLSQVFSLMLYVVVIRAVASWFVPSGYNPAINLLTQLTEPFLTPLRKIIPPTAGLDWAPMLLLFILWFFQNILSKL